MLFDKIEDHLLNDAAPSGAIAELAGTPEFDTFPFSMLLKLKATPQSPRHHPEGSVWNHTLLVVDEAAKRRDQSSDPKVFMWAALLHDIGKPETTRNRHGKITAYEHDAAGERLTQSFLTAFTTDRRFIEKTAALVRYHMHILYVNNNLPFGDISGMKRHTDIHEVGLLGLCDRLGRLGADRETEEKQVKRFLNSVIKNERSYMAKAGMRRPDPSEPHGTESNRINHFKKNQTRPVPEIQGKAKFTKEKAGSLTIDKPNEQT